jgi:hypothetical protein
MNSDDVRRQVRREVRQLRLGGMPRSCVVCGETHAALLRPASRPLVEFHHLGGEANDPDFGVFLCLTHHAWCTEAMRDSGVPLGRAEGRSLLERLQAVLRGLSVFLELACRLLGTWADGVGALVAALDRSYPGWRGLEESS